MKNILLKLFSIVLLASLTGCGLVSYVGIDPNPSPLQGENIRYMGTVEAVSHKEVYVFGIGGSGNRESAIREAIKLSELKEGEELVNMSCVAHTRFIPFTWLPIVIVRDYTVTADKISHNVTAPSPASVSEPMISEASATQSFKDNSPVEAPTASDGASNIEKDVRQQIITECAAVHKLYKSNKEAYRRPSYSIGRTLINDLGESNKTDNWLAIQKVNSLQKIMLERKSFPVSEFEAKLEKCVSEQERLNLFLEYFELYN